MFLKLGFEDFEGLFLASKEKKVINDIGYYSKDYQKVTKLLNKEYDEEELLVPIVKCECEYLSNRHNEGKLCPLCNTVCSDEDKNIDPVLWFRSIEDDSPFVSIVFWIQLKRILSLKHDYPYYLSGGKLDDDVKIDSIILDVVNNIMDGRRDYVVFINKLEEIMTYIIENLKYKNDKVKELRNLLDIYRDEKHKILTHYLPVVNKKLFASVKTNKGRFVDLIPEVGLTNAVLFWIKRCSDKKKKGSTAELLHVLGETYETIIKKNVGGKQGNIRQHCLSGRINFSFRALITSITEPHCYNEIHVPWGIGVTSFRPHVLNKLLRRGYKYREAIELIETSVSYYSIVIDDILNELIRESKYMGLPVAFQRNPSQKQGSIQLVFITRFKSDISDKTISISDLTVSIFNADFDGDEMNAGLLLDNRMTEAFKVMDASYSLPEGDEPYVIGRHAKLTTQTNCTLAKFLEIDRNVIPVEDLRKKLILEN